LRAEPPLHVSLSYTTGTIALAFARVPVGVDVEAVKPDIPWKALAPLVLPARACRRIAARPAYEQVPAFLQAWTAIEARGKAVGLGLAARDPEPDVVQCLIPARDLVAAVAVRGHQAVVRSHEATSLFPMH
jgi:4'-phosphopantetheinyl transferase